MIIYKTFDEANIITVYSKHENDNEPCVVTGNMRLPMSDYVALASHITIVNNELILLSSNEFNKLDVAFITF